MLQDDESLALALRGGLRGRFQGTFNQLENAVEVLDDYMLQHLNPAEYADLRTMMREINWQLAYLRRLGDHAADAAAAPVLQMLRVPAPLELLSQLHETVELFTELTVGGTRAVHARLETAPGLDVFPTMGDPALLDGLLVNLFTNSIQAVPERTPWRSPLPARRTSFRTAITGPAYRRMPAACCWRASGPRSCWLKAAWACR